MFEFPSFNVDYFSYIYMIILVQKVNYKSSIIQEISGNA